MITMLYRNQAGELVSDRDTERTCRFVEVTLGMVEALNPDSLQADTLYLLGKKGIVGVWRDMKRFEGIDTRKRLRVELTWTRAQAG